MGSLLHFTYKKSGNNFFVGLFTPINESVFEHLKLVIFPIIIFSIFFYFFTEKRFNNIFFISFISICIACFSVIFINYLGNCLFQRHIPIYSILNYLISMFIGFAFILSCVNSVYFNDKFTNVFLLGIILNILLIIITFYFTISPPILPLFTPPNEKSIINKYML